MLETMDYMGVIHRNFFRLLRAGAFGTDEVTEPMSAAKWNRLLQLSVMHGVAAWTYKGLERCGGQFFVQQISKAITDEWRATASAGDSGDEDSNVLLMGDRLTNPLLNRRLQQILDSEDSTPQTRRVLLELLGIARFIMNAGIPVKRCVELGIGLRENRHLVDFAQLKTWIGQLRLYPMAQLAGIMLVRLLRFPPEELPFLSLPDEAAMDRSIQEVLRQKNSHADEWYFSQGKDIFVHTSNADAMMWHVRRSVHNLRYYPSETVTNFFVTFAHSLSHIEE